MERGGSSASRPLFPRGPSISLDDFSNKDFIVGDFVDSLAEAALPASRRSGPAHHAFDPKPLIRGFESEPLPPASPPPPPPTSNFG
jgi:hypothetical protein